MRVRNVRSFPQGSFLNNRPIFHVRKRTSRFFFLKSIDIIFITGNRIQVLLRFQFIYTCTVLPSPFHFYLCLSLFPLLLYHFLSMPLRSSVEVDRLPPKSIQAVSVTISQKWYGLISILDSVSVCALLTQPIFLAECPTFQFDSADFSASVEKSFCEN